MVVEWFKELELDHFFLKKIIFNSNLGLGVMSDRLLSKLKLKTFLRGHFLLVVHNYLLCHHYCFRDYFLVLLFGGIIFIDVAHICGWWLWCYSHCCGSPLLSYTCCLPPFHLLIVLVVVIIVLLLLWLVVAHHQILDLIILWS